MTSSIHTGRRAFVKLAAAAALTPFAGRLAHAAGDPLVLGTWGGDHPVPSKLGEGRILQALRLGGAGK